MDVSWSSFLIADRSNVVRKDQRCLASTTSHFFTRAYVGTLAAPVGGCHLRNMDYYNRSDGYFLTEYNDPG